RGMRVLAPQSVPGLLRGMRVLAPVAFPGLLRTVRVVAPVAFPGLLRGMRVFALAYTLGTDVNPPHIDAFQACTSSALRSLAHSLGSPFFGRSWALSSSSSIASVLLVRTQKRPARLCSGLSWIFSGYLTGPPLSAVFA